ncbi:MAG: aminotransferase class I/II-fold pyridoxal phosphate-dependent enzyme [Dehalococcoidia bacterium]|nr:aminotransferase class I/II-fold pyridoxal phosphate-dependent enzyme [Dehalococcoidia bacterium]
MPDEFLPLARPDISEEEIAEVVDTLRSGWLVYGPKTQRLEEDFRAMTGTKHAVAVSSCTAGMHLALLAAGIGHGDEVITSTITFASTVNVILHTGATPVLADICGDDLNIDPAEIARRITPRTKAIMPVHYAGQACRMDEILPLARERGIRVIEDAAHCAGSSYKEQPVGGIGDASVFSFYAIKNMTTGEGGMVTTDDDALASKVRILRNNGLDNNAWNRYSAAGSPFYSVLEPGFNYRLTDLQAAIGIGQLHRLPQFNARRSELAARYTEAFAELPEVETPTVRPDVTTNWYIYVIRLSGLNISRDEVVAELKQRGIGSAVHFLPVHMHPYYRETFGYQPGDYPIAEREFERILSLPLFPQMTDSDVDRVVSAVEEIVAQHRA